MKIQRQVLFIFVHLSDLSQKETPVMNQLKHTNLVARFCQWNVLILLLFAKSPQFIHISKKTSIDNRQLLIRFEDEHKDLIPGKTVSNQVSHINPIRSLISTWIKLQQGASDYRKLFQKQVTFQVIIAKQLL